MKKLFRELLAGGYETAPLDTQYKIKNRVLYFQSSSSRKDWFLNFFALPVDGRPAGFELAWRASKNEIACEVLKKGGIDLAVGYSRGGPLSVYAAELFGVPFVTFGSPRVGRHASRGERVAGPRDIVTLAPPFYRHAGKRVKIGKARRGNIKPWEWISGHGPAEYLQRLEGVEYVSPDRQ